MDIKVNILKKIAGIDEDIKFMISHHMLTYLSLMVISFIGIIILFFLYKLLCVFNPQIASFITGVFALFLFIYFTLNFFDIYLDAVIITDKSLIIYKWYGLFKTSADVISLEAVESVYAKQEGLIDTVFNNGDIVFRRAGHENYFDDIYGPQDAATRINYILSQLQKKKEHEEQEPEPEPEPDFKIFVEAMAELIKEYKTKK